VKIVWQSFVDEELNAPYISRLEAYLNDTSSSGVSVKVIGMSPPAREFGRLQEFRCASAAIKNAILAERDGADAFVIGHFQEPGLYEARSAVSIPVIGVGEATLLWASHLGRRIGLISLDDVFEVIHYEQMDRYGLGDRLLGVNAINMGVADFAPAFNGDKDSYDAMISKFRVQAQILVDRGADVIVPAGGLFSLLTAEEKSFKVGIAPVIPCTPIALGWAELAARLHRSVDLQASRGPSFAKASERAIADFLNQP
jgi:Asp/Glu/hydantoin racemase